jgi:hypothetical protein
MRLISIAKATTKALKTVAIELAKPYPSNKLYMEAR